MNQIPPPNHNIEIDLESSTGVAFNRPLKKEDREDSLSEIVDYREDSTPQAAHYRKLFYDFLKKARIRTSEAASYFNRLRLNLRCKVTRVLNPSELETTYEKMIQRSLSKTGGASQGWKEDELLFLISVITHYSLIYEVDCASMVILLINLLTFIIK